MTDWPAEVERLRAEQADADLHHFQRSITVNDIYDAVTRTTLIRRDELISIYRRDDIIRARVVLVGCMREMMYPPPTIPEMAHAMMRRGHGAAHGLLQRWHAKGDAEKKRWRDAVYGAIIAARTTARAAR